MAPQHNPHYDGNHEQHPTMRYAGHPAGHPQGSAHGAASHPAAHPVGQAPASAARVSRPHQAAGTSRPHAQGRAAAAQGVQQRPAHPHASSRVVSHATAPHTGTRQVTAPLRTASPYQQQGGAGRPPRRRQNGLPAAFALLAGLAVVLGAGALWWFVLRTVPVTVNAQELNVHEGVSVQQLLDDNDAFGVSAGNLVSVGGNLITEGGGTRATVTVNGEEIPADQFASRGLMSGDTLEVGNGTDVQEDYDESTESLAPGLQTDGTGAIQFVSQWGQPGEKKVWTGKESGEKVDKEVTKNPVDMVISYINPKPQDGKKYVALTFDDGPSQYTGKILDILKEKGVHATFYNLGQNAESNAALSKRVVDEGHEMASHTNQHMNLPNEDRDSLRNEITSAADRIEQASGYRPQMIRAPYGAFTTVEWGRAADLISCNVLWNIDTLDWKRPGADAITQAVLSNAYNGAIVLMHDGGGDRTQDIEALPGIIDGLKDAGYKLVTVKELMKLDGRFPDDVVNGTVKVPDGAVLPEG